jgi:hypothetical protein
VRERSAPRVINRAVSTEQADVRGGSRGPRIGPTILELSVQLTLRADDVEQIAEHPCLLPGTTRRVVAQLTRSSSKGEAKSQFTLSSSAVRLSLFCADCPELIITAYDEAVSTSPYVTLDPKAQLGQTTVERHLLAGGSVELDFDVFVPSSCPRQAIHIQLIHASLSVCTLALELLGKTLAPAGVGLDTFAIDPHATIPAEVAFLSVSENDEQGLILQGFHAQHALSPSSVSRGPDTLCLAELFGKVKDESILDRMHEFSRKRVSQLQQWLQKLLATHPEDLVLVLIDRSRAEVPWELLDLGTKRTGYLGSLVEVVRWADIGAYDQRAQLSMADCQYAGSAARFIHGTSATSSEGVGLARLRATELKSMSEALSRLNSDDDLVMLYVGCHGKYVAAAGAARPIFSLPDVREEDSHPFMEIDVERVSMRSERRAVVMVNACQSGRLRHDGSSQYGLAERFLARVAYGYLGTLSDVYEQHAAEVGADLLERIAADPCGCRVSRALRDIRRAYVREHGRVAQAQGSSRLLHAFLYVYYGAPFVRVLIRSAPADETRTGAG